MLKFPHFEVRPTIISMRMRVVNSFMKIFEVVLGFLEISKMKNEKQTSKNTLKTAQIKVKNK